MDLDAILSAVKGLNASGHSAAVQAAAEAKVASAVQSVQAQQATYAQPSDADKIKLAEAQFDDAAQKLAEHKLNTAILQTALDEESEKIAQLALLNLFAPEVYKQAMAELYKKEQSAKVAAAASPQNQVASVLANLGIKL